MPNPMSNLDRGLIALVVVLCVVAIALFAVLPHDALNVTPVYGLF